MVEPVTSCALTEFTDTLRIFRLERLTTKACGNKQFKLRDNLLQLKRSGARSVLSFGGVWSNHLHAFAIACKAQNLRAVAVVRGESVSNSALLDNAVEHELVVRYVSRSDYRRRHDEAYVSQLMSDLNCDAWLPEGGSNQLAVRSCSEIAALINSSVERPIKSIALAVGTGATMAGIVNGASEGQNVIGIPVVQDSRLQSNIENWIDRSARAEWCLLAPADPPRYGKVDQLLLEFVLQVYRDTGVILDPVYSAKALRYLHTVISADKAQGECVFVHTGGLGGCLGFADEFMTIDSALARQMLSEITRLLGFDNSSNNFAERFSGFTE